MTAALNVERGEFPLTLGERTLVLAPEFDRIVRIEALIGRSLVKLMNDLESGAGATLMECTHIVHQLCVDEKPPSKDEIGKLIMDSGIVSVLPAISVLFSRVLLGKGKIPKGERAASRS